MKLSTRKTYKDIQEILNKWYDSLNRMEISISWDTCSCARWEDENKIVVLEV